MSGQVANLRIGVPTRPDEIWAALTKPQRELLLSCAAGAPIVARADVRGRLWERGLICYRDKSTVPEPTLAARLVLHWRLPASRLGAARVDPQPTEGETE